MNRRDFLRLAPVLSALPLVGRWFGGNSTMDAPESKPPFELYSLPRETAPGVVIDKNPSAWAKNHWLDEYNHLIVERWNGEITSQQLIYENDRMFVRTYRLNAAGEWEEVT